LDRLTELRGHNVSLPSQDGLRKGASCLLRAISK